MSTREPVLTPIKIVALRPTQMTVGLREVDEKRRLWREHSGDAGGRFLGRHMIPVILGPKANHYVIDHHHLVRALLDEGVRDILVNVVADLGALKSGEFWSFLDNHNWCHPYDDAGVRRDFADIPASVAKLRDDPFRSLAGELRRMGGYAKDSTPFSEFVWADFLRRRIKRKTVETSFERALEKALALARSSEAGHMPGWCGACPID